MLYQPLGEQGYYYKELKFYSKPCMTKQDVRMNLTVYEAHLGWKWWKKWMEKWQAWKVLNFLSKTIKWSWRNKFWFCWLPASLTGEQSIQKVFEQDWVSQGRFRNGSPCRVAAGQCREYGKVEVALFGTQNTGAKWEVGVDEILQVLQWTPVCPKPHC